MDRLIVARFSSPTTTGDGDERPFTFPLRTRSLSDLIDRLTEAKESINQRLTTAVETERTTAAPVTSSGSGSAAEQPTKKLKSS